MAFTSETVRTFLAVLDAGSFSAAARALGRVPSAVSMTIAGLEAELDLRLFDRSGREPVPTGAARALEPQARAIAAGLARLEAHALALHAGLERRLSLAIAAELLLVPWSAPLAALAAEFPALEIDVVSGPQDEMMRRLHAGEVDLALVFERPRLDEREDFQEFSQELLVAVAAPSHPLVAATSRPRLSDLVVARQIAVTGRDAAAADPRLLLSRSVWHTDSHLSTLLLVEAGLGWAFLPRRLVEPSAAAGRLAEIAFADMSNELRLWVDLVWRNDRPLGTGARRFITLIAAASARAAG
ncbi:MAG TPA: LysR family transcriptional regulator [Amaricoccus sp.]|uniref:LysR family transcriptional regulator n=1 Tax=Amaricoccus sp. TaxID=1872485 RepID=UPI002CEB044C|nr:LysR family transcriptional regulator [Amaricoccus sp.]HRO11165.1 LysR family transcriptional regulator [Amaricoccus sp.]